MTDPDLPLRSYYDLLGFRVEVATNAPAFQHTLDRLNAPFRLAHAPERADAAYEAVSYQDGRIWELTFQGDELRFCDSLMGAVSHVEWHACDQAIDRRHDLLHVHGAALASGDVAVLLPGGSGIGKTTFALALALRGLRLLADDVVFLHPETWRPEPFPRAFHVHDDALLRLAPLGLRYAPADHIGPFLCADALGPWDPAPGPPLRHVVFPRLDPTGPLALEPLADAEATVELLRYSRNLRKHPRFGLDVIPRLLAQAQCYVLRRNDDLAAAADLLIRVLAGR